ncbi:MAG: MarR family transcriptional regulator [Gammaproteobacteria bacterium]
MRRIRQQSLGTRGREVKQRSQRVYWYLSVVPGESARIDDACSFHYKSEIEFILRGKGRVHAKLSRQVGAMKAAGGRMHAHVGHAEVGEPAGVDPRDADPRDAISAESRKILDDFTLESIASHLLRRAHFSAEDLFAKEFSNESITPRQKAALVMLYQYPGLSQNALADKLFMDRNTVADMVRRLASNGLVRRTAARADHRAYELFLTVEGATLLDRVMPRDVRVEQSVLERLPIEYRPLFIKCIRLIVERRPDTLRSLQRCDPINPT